MGEFDGLRLGRCPRGEQHDPDRIGVGELGGRLGAAGRVQELRRTDGAVAVANRVAVFVVNHHQGVGQAVEQSSQTVGRQPVVQRGHRYRGACGGEQQQRQHRATGADVGDVLGARRRDDAGTAVGKRAQFGGGEP